MNCCGFRLFPLVLARVVMLIGSGSLPIAIAISSRMVLDGFPRSVTSYSAFDFLYDCELIPDASDIHAQVGT
jgi:hypothetical protein